MTALSDEELIAKYREAGGRQAGVRFVDELFQRHYARVALWCYRFAGDRDRAADLAQEVFSKAWAHLDHFRSDSRFTTWLYTITRNHCFTAARSRAMAAEEAMETGQLDAVAASPAGFDTEMERASAIAAAKDLIATELTPVEARVMTLHFAEEVPLASITRLLRLDNPSGAKAYVVSAKRKLQAAMDRLARRKS